jgi:hypothetical protein
VLKQSLPETFVVRIESVEDADSPQTDTLPMDEPARGSEMSITKTAGKQLDGSRARFSAETVRTRRSGSSRKVANLTRKHASDAATNLNAAATSQHTTPQLESSEGCRELPLVSAAPSTVASAKRQNQPLADTTVGSVPLAAVTGDSSAVGLVTVTSATVVSCASEASVKVVRHYVLNYRRVLCNH